MKIAIASDHAGFKYKEQIKIYLSEQGHEVRDFGTYSAESCDYPDFIRPAAEMVANGKFERGIVLGGSGNGEAMVANKVKDIRCALCWDLRSARLSREHNDANILCLRAEQEQDTLREVVTTFLVSEFEGGRHLRRLNQIKAMEG